MDMVRMVTTAEHQYYGRRLYPDDEYDCEAPLVDLMQKQGWSRPKAFEANAAPAYQTRDMAAGAPAAFRRRRK